ncbi:MAG: error-prone DNA polymerase, partial [Marinicaulis sp.]|nr:error-prone DNA polymerase [Marinicaulis sp.]
LAVGERGYISHAETFLSHLRSLRQNHPGSVYLAAAPRYDGADAARFAMLEEIARRLQTPLVAAGDVIMHEAHRRPLADVLSCIREKTTIDKLGRHAQVNAEHRLKSPFEMRRLFAAHEDAVARTLEIAERCKFSLDELRYEYPDEVSDGEEPLARLKRLTEAGLNERYPGGVPENVRATVDKEYRLIEELDYARYFLTVHDVVDFARSRDILCQGRGSAANSVVCYALGITSIGPELISMVFERFVSEARNEPPDIDVDFEHERREEVIQHIYEKYGRHRAGICATVIHFRSRAAIREVGKAMGLSADTVSAMASQVWGWSSEGVDGTRAEAAGLSLADRRVRQTLALTQELIGFPRHLSQHVGGFVITKGRLDEFCAIENAAMEDRTVIEWDKDDIDVLGMLKVDVLSLGMLTCIRKAFDLLASHEGVQYNLATLPAEDPAVYDMLCEGDSLGVFQVESRAQMNFLPRMRPRAFYDLVIEVAIVRPGPIQGDMVHPYIRRRKGEEKVTYPSEDLREVLGKTLGVPLFQEQAMRVAVVVAGFDPSEADALRRSLGAFRGPGTVSKFKRRFLSGAVERSYDIAFAERCFSQLEGFSGYGFPESHAASFALLVYASAWLKKHHPAIFCCAILNSQPMGFYAPAQLVRDAREHGVDVRPISINASYWDNTLEPDGYGGHAVRLGFRQLKGFREEDAAWISAARGNGYRSVEAVWRRAGVKPAALTKLAEADAFADIELTRRDALWAAKAIRNVKPLPLFADEENDGVEELPVVLPPTTLGEDVFEDYVSTRLSLRAHPVELLRPRLGENVLKADQQMAPADGESVTIAGLVITRQRPGTASGVIFVTLEDETGVANVIVWPKIFERNRKTVMAGRFLRVRGRLQREGSVVHIIAWKIDDMSHLLDQMGEVTAAGRTLDMALNHGADEAKNPITRVDRGPGSKRQPIPRPRHPREQAKVLFPSRDFH